MNSAPAFVGARGTDSVTLLNDTSAAALKAAGFDFALQYLGSVTPEIVQAITGAGLGFMPVTYADRFSGAQAAAECAALGLPPGVTVWLDLEGIGPTVPAGDLIAKVNGWAASIQTGGWTPGLYVGAGDQLTGPEVFELAVVRYWKGQSRLVDRNGALVEPACGWCMTQLFPHVPRCGVDVDIDVIGEDYHGRVPTWAV